MPLALHGSSRLSTVVLKQLIAEGIAKVNIGTDLKAAYTASLRGFLTELPEEHEPRKVFAFAREQMKNLVRERLGLLGSVDKASEGRKILRIFKVIVQINKKKSRELWSYVEEYGYHDVMTSSHT